eukprot:gene34311-42309_t
MLLAGLISAGIYMRKNQALNAALAVLAALSLGATVVMLPRWHAASAARLIE